MESLEDNLWQGPPLYMFSVNCHLIDLTDSCVVILAQFLRGGSTRSPSDPEVI
ncbi:unnamed protein product [Penicillium salamii]|nr:unnamed protein product [Penicillium salamii]